MNRILKSEVHTKCEYNIEIDNGILSSNARIVESLKDLSSTFAIISDDIVAKLYGESLCHSLSSAGLTTHIYPFFNGEQNKTRATKERLENQMFEDGLGRDTCIIGLGGGIATDLAGYLAATYCRGVPFVAIPTTLLGMVDASIGGKCGVNVPQGKNMVGCIYQPSKVIIDPNSLLTLPTRELRNGVVEMIKHGLVADHQFFEFLENNAIHLLALDATTLEQAIFESCRIKKEVVEQDEKDVGKRRLLNFGHTVGHALELMTNYSLSHGEAVAIGILVESYLAVQLGHLSLNSFDRINKILKLYELPLRLPKSLPLESILETMTMDKKSVEKRPRFVMISKIGSSLTYNRDYCTHIDETLLKKTLQWMNNDLCDH